MKRWTCFLTNHKKMKTAKHQPSRAEGYDTWDYKLPLSSITSFNCGIETYALDDDGTLFIQIVADGSVINFRTVTLEQRDQLLMILNPTRSKVGDSVVLVEETGDVFTIFKDK